MTTAVSNIDFSRLSLDNVPSSSVLSDDDLRELGVKVCDILQREGTMYLSNHGIHRDLVRSHFNSAKKFFESPEGFKSQYKDDSLPSIGGWTPRHVFDLDHSKPDVVDSFFYVSPLVACDVKQKVVPIDEELPGFKQDLDDMFVKTLELTKRILEAVAVGLGIERDYFSKHYKRAGYSGNETWFVLKACWYPPVSEDESRFSSHTDLGVITIVFQDDHSGLEFQKQGDKSWTPIPPVEGTVVVLVGEALQRWTADALIATRHRVVPYKDNCNATRQSLVVLGNCDNATLLTPCDGSDKYPPITSGDYMKERVDEIITLGYRYPQDL